MNQAKISQNPKVRFRSITKSIRVASTIQLINDEDPKISHPIMIFYQLKRPMLIKTYSIYLMS